MLRLHLALPMVVAALAGLLAGCTVGPDFVRPAEPTGERYQGPGEEAALDRASDRQGERLGDRVSGDWWALFRCAELDQVVRDALARNRDLAAARSALERAAQQAVAAGGALFPHADLMASADRERVNFAAYGLTSPNADFNLYQIGPTVSYSLDLFGKAHRQVEQANALAEAEGYHLDAAYLALTGNVVVEAVTIAETRAQIAAVEDILADDRQTLDLVRTAKAVGAGTDVDVLHAESQLANDRTLLPPLRQQASVASHALAVLAGRTPASWSPPEFALDGFHLPDSIPVSLPSALVRQRPDILAAEAVLHAASAAVGVATAQRYPDFTVSADLLQQATFPGHLFREAASAATVGGGLAAPLFRGGALAAEQAAAEADLRTAEARYEQTVLRSFAQVADSLAALAHDADELAAQEKARDAAAAAVRLARLSYAAGNAGVLQVLDAERQYGQACLGAARARGRRDLDTAQLFLAMGGGWWDWPDRAGELRE